MQNHAMQDHFTGLPNLYIHDISFKEQYLGTSIFIYLDNNQQNVF